MGDATFQNEFPFELPVGYQDANGTLHKQGVMRRAHNIDEIEPLGDPRVQQNQAFLVILLMARVITKLGDITEITPEMIGKLYPQDMSYLQDLYRQINEAPTGV
jgi:hypothetical protein